MRSDSVSWALRVTSNRWHASVNSRRTLGAGDDSDVMNARQLHDIDAHGRLLPTLSSNGDAFVISLSRVEQTVAALAAVITLELS